MNTVSRIGLQFVVAVLLALWSGCGFEPLPVEAGASLADTNDCGPRGDLLHASPVLHGSFESGDAQFWTPAGSCPAWGDGVEIQPMASLGSSGQVKVSKAGCRLTSMLVPVPPRSQQDPSLRQPFSLQVRSMRDDDACRASSASPAHCVEAKVQWYDMNGRFMFEELYLVGGATPGIWHTAEVNGYASDYAGYYSVTVGGPMYGIAMSPTYIDFATVTFYDI